MASTPIQLDEPAVIVTDPEPLSITAQIRANQSQNSKAEIQIPAGKLRQWLNRHCLDFETRPAR